MTKFTIIIPTYNRPNYLKRTLGYYKECKDDFEIIIADSSSDENKKKNKEVISPFPSLKILHLNNYLESINPWYKFADAINFVKSKYCLFCSDDDFVIPKTVSFCTDFLENNSNFITAHGHYIMFYLKKKRGRNKKIYWLSEYSLESLTNSQAELRLKEHLSDYSLPTFSAVHRTSFLKMALEETTKYAHDNRFGELLPSMLASIYGKIKCFDLPYAVQEININSTGTTTETLEDFIQKGTYEEKYRKFRNCLSIHLSKNSKLDRKESEKILDSAMNDYLGENYPENSKSFLTKKMKDILKILPPEVYNIIKSLYIRSRLSKLKDNFSILINSPSFEYYEDFRKIQDCLISHNEI